MKKLKILLLSVFLFAFMGGMNSLNAGCNTGGPGSTSCTDAGTVEVSLLWGLWSWGFDYENSISCGEGYYACCNGDGASCIVEPEEPE